MVLVLIVFFKPDNKPDINDFPPPNNGGMYPAPPMNWNAPPPNNNYHMPGPMPNGTTGGQPTNGNGIQPSPNRNGAVSDLAAPEYEPVVVIFGQAGKVTTFDCKVNRQHDLCFDFEFGSEKEKKTVTIHLVVAKGDCRIIRYEMGSNSYEFKTVDNDFIISENVLMADVNDIKSFMKNTLGIDLTSAE